MTELIGGVLMMVGGGMLSAAAVPLARSSRSRAAELVEALPFTPAPLDTPPDMQALLARLG